MNIHEFGSRLRFVAQQRRFLLLIFYIAVIAGLYYLPGVFHPHSVEEIRLWVMGFGVCSVIHCASLTFISRIAAESGCGNFIPSCVGYPAAAVGRSGQCHIVVRYGPDRHRLHLFPLAWRTLGEAYSHLCIRVGAELCSYVMAANGSLVSLRCY